MFYAKNLMKVPQSTVCSVIYTVELPFGGVRYTTESPFGSVRYTTVSLFSGVTTPRSKDTPPSMYGTL